MVELAGNSRTPSLAEVITSAIERRLCDIHTMLPGVVVKFNPANQTADVLPLLKNVVLYEDGQKDLETLPILPEIPVWYLRGGGYFLSLPLQPGDNVMVFFCERSLDRYLASGGKAPVEPGDMRMHDLSDAVAVPGFLPTTKALKEELSTGAVFGKERGAQLRATGAAIEVTTAGAPAASNSVAMSHLVLIELGKIAVLLNGLIGPGSYVPAPVASTNLKAD